MHIYNEKVIVSDKIVYSNMYKFFIYLLKIILFYQII